MDSLTNFGSLDMETWREAKQNYLGERWQLPTYWRGLFYSISKIFCLNILSVCFSTSLSSLAAAMHFAYTY